MRTTLPYPQVLRCPLGNVEEDECGVQHNPEPGYEDHHYGCECDGCVRWYWLLGS